MSSRDRSLAAVLVSFIAAFLAGAAVPPKATVAAPLNSSLPGPGHPPVKLYADVVVLPPVVHTNLIPASGTNPAGYQVVWKVKNQGAAPTANRVKLTLSCQPAAGMAGSPPTPQQAQQICFTLNNTSYLSYPSGQPPNVPVPLKPGQESEPFFVLSTTAAAPCSAWHARVTAVVEAYDEGPTGGANNTRVFEICEMKAIPR
ncbi:MAG TPA: hypothetical protein VMT19_04095 [Thermoanaerobaculaceae bacterium]|nr:hypothetical protein [Thermoanaerobaculaceae bacterium]